MKILVGVKHVPDTAARVRIAEDGVSLDEREIKMILSPYDEFALEEALRQREARGEGEVLVVSAGAETAQATLRQCLAMGADRALLIQDARYDRADGLARARALAAVARREQPALILVGKYGVGTDEGQTGPMLAELLGWPHAAAVVRLQVHGERFEAHREIEGAVEVLEGPLPAVITTEKGLNEPRYPSLQGIMAAKRKPLDVVSPQALGLDAEELGPGQRVVWERLELPSPRPACRTLEGDPDTVVAELVRLLREEAKVL